MEMTAESQSSTDTRNKTWRQFVVNFVTKDSRYAVASTPFTIIGSNGCPELNSLIKTLIAENNDISNESEEDIEFDFLINGKLLRVSLEDYVENERMSYESQIEIEFISKSLPPKPHNSLLHDDWVSCVDCLHNWIISGCYDSSVHIWDLRSEGQHKIAIPAHTGAVKDIKWIANKQSINEHMFVSSSHDETAIVWKWSSDNNQVDYLFSCRGHTRSVDCIDVTNDLIATGSYDQMLKIWSLNVDKNDDRSEEPSTSKQKKLKTSDGKSESSDKVRTPVITLSGHKEAITGCVWMKDTTDVESSIETISTCSMDNTIRLWDIEVGEVKQTLTGNKAFLDISYSPINQNLITGSCDRHIRLWDPRSSEGSLVKGVYTSHQSWVSCVDWSKTNEYEFISGSYDNIVKQWDIRSPNAPLYDLIGHEDKVLCVNWSPNQYMISGAADNQLKVFSNNQIIKL